MVRSSKGAMSRPRDRGKVNRKSMRSVFCAGAPGTPDALEAEGGVFGNSTVGETDQSGAVIKIYGMKSQFDSGLKVVCYTKEKRKSNEQCEQS